MGAGALAPGRVCTEFPKDKEFRAFEMLEKIELSSKPRRCEGLVLRRSHALIRAKDSLPHGDQNGFHRPGNADARRTTRERVIDPLEDLDEVWAKHTFAQHALHTFMQLDHALEDARQLEKLVERDRLMWVTEPHQMRCFDCRNVTTTLRWS